MNVVNGFEEIIGGEMFCNDCKQIRDTRFVPVSFVVLPRAIEAHTVQICGLCSSIDLRKPYTDHSRTVDSSKRW